MPQPRRRPKRNGGGSRSITGAQRNLSAYGVPTRAKAPILARLIPAVASHADSVEAVSSSGSPLANPSGRIISTRRSAYTARERLEPLKPDFPSSSIAVPRGPEEPLNGQKPTTQQSIEILARVQQATTPMAVPLRNKLQGSLTANSETFRSAPTIKKWLSAIMNWN